MALCPQIHLIIVHDVRTMWRSTLCRLEKIGSRGLHAATAFVLLCETEGREFSNVFEKIIVIS